MSSPLQPHAASPAELAERLAAERHGEPFLVYRDGDGHQALVALGDASRLTIGRRAGNDIRIAWDPTVSSSHAALERVGADWSVLDDGLSRHGTFVNGDRVTGRRRLANGDVIFVGATALAFRAPQRLQTSATADLPAGAGPVSLTPAQRRVLIALCRPFKDAAYASPAGNRQIAAELVVTVDAVKARLRELFDAFGVADLPQNEKRAALAVEALRRGVVQPRDL
jgi:pSer/pThr/pTyr-binding forkhead associated (FHA) protein